mmetsp:Transcript_19730/g.28382  ORF Transcript_19730/g.28382 Transcript_19730/m.28382 type:complete len:812 (+) Transcript_19730:108-2543(+)
MKLKIHWLTVFLLARHYLCKPIHRAEVTCDNQQIICTLENGFVKADVSLSGGAFISSLSGDFNGSKNYSKNLLTNSGFQLEREEDDGTVTSAAGRGPSPLYFTHVGNRCASVVINEVYDDIDNPSSVESWSIELCRGQRSLTLLTKGGVLNISSEYTLKSVRHSLYATPASIFGLYDTGVVQMMNASPERSYFGSSDALTRLYTLGEHGSIDILRPGAQGGESDVTVMLSAASSSDSTASFRTGFQEILVGTYELTLRDLWTEGWNAQNGGNRLESVAWEKKLILAPNNYNFPSGGLPSGEVPNMDTDGAGDLGAFMTGIYANGVGNLCTYNNEVEEGLRVAQIATTLRQDNSRGYDGTYNYFDPDNFFALSAILYSGDAYLQNQVRQVIERTGSFMKTETGQLPHHFNGAEPYYLALSGETQTGPNIFWVKTALQYAATSGDFRWLRDYMPTLRVASSFVFNLIENDTYLLYAPGSLMIDVFIRNNYTSDSNAMVVGFLRDFAAAERAVGNSSRAGELEMMASEVSKAMNEYLWANESSGGDHFITQLNIDGTTRDFVDYDANVIAIAHGVADSSRARLIQKRIDGGRCSAASGAGAQFVSEQYYGVEDTTDGNTGDSWCSMGRIGWFDAVGRKLLGSAEDLNYFNDVVLEPLKRDLNANTWLHERYGCDGMQQENRTMFYFEYPALVSMLLKDIRYGVKLDISGVTIDPFLLSTGDSEFEYHTGNINVLYSPKEVSISVPVDDNRPCNTQYSIRGLLPHAVYETLSSEHCACGKHRTVVRTDETGTAIFLAPGGIVPCVLTLFYVENTI